MRYEKINIHDYFDNVADAQVTLYIPDISEEIDTEIQFPYAVICPGGGYWWTSDREAEPCALRLLGHGIATAVVRYSCGGTHYPTQLLQILAAITYVRRNSADLHIHPEKIAVMGFSAGGHAACTAGLFWQETEFEQLLGIQHGEDKPNGMILCYPVITSGKHAHEDSFKCLLGDNPLVELLEKMSLEKQVTENAPQAFIWHTFEDGLVPMESSLLLATALRKKGIPLEMHIYPKGHHGMSLCDETVNKAQDIYDAVKYCSNWVEHCIHWIKEIL